MTSRKQTAPILMALLLFSCQADPTKLDSRSKDTSNTTPSPGAPTDARGPQPHLDPNAAFNLVPKQINLQEKIDNLTLNSAFKLTNNGYGTASQAPFAWGNGSQDFYLGMNKNELNKLWFLVAKTKQLYPADLYVPAFTLGTRVVSFKIQNDRIFIFDRSERHGNGPVLNPPVLVDSYPIVNPSMLPPGTWNSNFVYFDPSAGESKFGPVQDLLGQISAGKRTMETDLRYLSAYKTLTDGVYFETVFSGVSNAPVGETVDANPNRLIGSLGLSIRRYAETPGFTSADYLNLSDDFYFPAWDAFKNPNAAGITYPIAKWRDLRPGMTKIPFKISPEIRATDTAYANYDIELAVKKGFEAWNTALGFPVFDVAIAAPGTSWASDDTNMLVWNPNPSLDYAYADWRVNPKSGEIRSATIYMDAKWVLIAEQLSSYYSSSSTQGRSQQTAPMSSKAALPKAFSWGPLTPSALCSMPSGLPNGANEIRQSTASPQAVGMSQKAFVENYITHVVAHEIGHILGLRHNFHGSNASDTTSSSIMDYLPSDWRAAQPNPGVYDIAAVKYLYGLSPAEPSQPFCTDEDTEQDPKCRLFDYGINALALHMIPDLDYLKSEYTAAPASFWENYIVAYSQDILDFFQGGSPATQLQAWEGLLKGIKAESSATAPQNSKDQLSKWILSTAFKDKQEDSPFSMRFIAKPRVSLTAAPVVAKDLCDIGNNVDTIRSVQTRIIAIDALKKLQNNPGLEALNMLKTELTAKVATLTGIRRFEEEDLLRRVEKYLSPYYD